MHRGIAQAKSLSDGHKRQRSSKRANLSHLVLCHFCAVALYAHGNARLPYHVLHVHNLRSKEKVFGVHTPRVVALVADAHALGNCAAMNLPRHSMRQCGSTSFVSKSHAQATISGCIEEAGPLPAASGLSDVFPESNIDRNGESLAGFVVALRGAVFTSLENTLAAMLTPRRIVHASKCISIQREAQWISL